MVKRILGYDLKSGEKMTGINFGRVKTGHYSIRPIVGAVIRNSEGEIVQKLGVLKDK